MTDNRDHHNVSSILRERLYQTIFETTGTAMVVVDNDTSILFANNEFADIAGMAKSEIEGKKKWTEFIDKDYVDIMLKYHRLRRSGEGNPPRSYESKIIGKGQTPYFVYVTVSMIQGTSQSVISFIDITEEKKVRKELHVMHNRQEALLNNIPDMVWLKDADGRYLAANQAFADIFGLAPHEFIGKTAFDVAPRDFALKQEKEDQRVLQSKKRIRTIMSLGLLGREEIWVEQIKTPLYDDEGLVVGLVGIARDITTFKESNEKLETVNKILEEQRHILEKKNSALQEVFDHIEREKEAVKREMCFNIEQLLLPTVKKMKQSPSYVTKKRLSLLEQNLTDIAQAFHVVNVDVVERLTPKEIEVCNMIKYGFSGKEIAAELKISYDTVETHRRNIRKKLNIAGSKVNLSSYLQSNTIPQA